MTAILTLLLSGCENGINVSHDAICKGLAEPAKKITRSLLNNSAETPDDVILSVDDFLAKLDAACAPNPKPKWTLR